MQSLELDRLRANFLRWLCKSHPGDYQRYANRPEIPQNEIRDFLKSKGIGTVNIHYLMKSMRESSLFGPDVKDQRDGKLIP